MTNELTWQHLRASCTELADGAFLATVQADGRPHVAWVGIGFEDQTLWTATYASSQKAKNLRHAHHVSMHWPERPDQLIFLRGTARLVDEPAEVCEVWDRDVLPYDQTSFFGTPTNPELLFVEITPTLASIHGGDPSQPPARWRPQT